MPNVKIAISIFSRIFMVFILLLLSFFSYGQEICNNGIDDDGDGLIDLNDTADCHCTLVTPQVASLIPNPSFETKACCPSSFSQLNCAQGWVQATSATSDYMNTCGMVFNAATAAGLVPFPEGNGAVGCIFAPTWQEYVGTCLISPMIADTSYSIQMNIASTPITGNGGVCNGGVINYGPINITIYGAPNCSALPVSTYGCPSSPWVVLGTASYTPSNSWGTITITCTPSVNINTIMIGSPCVLPAGYTYGPCYPYFYFDNLLLNTTSSFSSIITQTGNWCSNTSVLTGNSVAGASYQWYLNGVAVVGQTNNILNVSSNNLPIGSYSLVTIAGSDCSRASVSVVKSTNPPVILPAGPFCKYEPAILLNANTAGGVWGGTGITNVNIGVFNPAMASIGNNSIFYTIPGSGNCPSSDTITIVVNDAPISNAGNDLTICSGASGSIGVVPIAGYSYSWNPSAGLSSPFVSNPSITTINSGTTPLVTNYSLITTESASGCQAVDYVDVTVNPKPEITPAGPFCKYDPAVNLTANIPGGIWGGGGITNTSSGTFDPLIAVVGNNDVIYTVSGICPDSDTLTIIVGTAPVSDAGLDLSICSGSTGNIGSPAVTGSTYSWIPSAGLSSSSVSNPGINTVNNGTTPLITKYIATTNSAAGCQSKDSVIVTVNPQPILQITNPAAVCSPGNIDITAASITSGSAGGWVLTYWIDSLAAAALASPGAIITNGTYYIKATAVGGCIDIKPVIAAINPSPVSNAGADITLCTGDTGSIGGTIVPGNTYSWNPTTGLTASSSAVTSITLINSGILPMISNYVITSSALGCVSYDTVKVIVNPLATADAGPSQIICAGSGAALSGVIGASAVGGTWSGGNGNYTPSNNALNAVYTPSLTEINAGSVILTLTTNDPPGSCPAASSFVPITINPAATVNAGLNDTICMGNSVPLTGLFGGAATSAVWSGGGGTYIPNNTVSNAVYTPSIAETEAGIVSLTFTTDDPSGPCPAVSDNMALTIRPSPTANAGSEQYVCAGSGINLAGIIGGSATSGTWSGGAGSYSPGNSALNAIYTPTTAESASDSLILTLTTDNPLGFPCTVSASSVTIYFYKNPVVNFAADDADGCPVHCVNFTDLSVVGGGASIAGWMWDFGDNSPDSASQNPSHCYSQMGIYPVTLTATSSNNCSGTLTIPQMIQVFSIPSAEFDAAPNPATVLNPSVAFNDQSSSDVNYWYWSFGDGDTLTKFAPNCTHAFPTDTSGIYYTSLIVENSSGCFDTIIHEIVIGPEFSFFIPSAFTPNNDGVNDFFKGEGVGIVKYELMIFDRWGNMVFYSEDLGKGWDGKVNQDNESAQQDVYTWKVKLTDVFKKKYNFIGSVTILK